MKALRPLIVFILMLAGVVYVGGIIWAGLGKTVSDDAVFAITAIAGVLATNFGALLGITVSMSGSTHHPLSLTLRKAQRTTTDLLQVIAAYVYFVGLLAAAAFNLRGDVGGGDMLRNMTSTLIGVIVGVLAVALATEPEPYRS